MSEAYLGRPSCQTTAIEVRIQGECSSYLHNFDDKRKIMPRKQCTENQLTVFMGSKISEGTPSIAVGISSPNTSVLLYFAFRRLPE